MKKISITVIGATILLAAASTVAQAGGKGGASNFAPGRQSFSSTTLQTEPGKSQFAPGDVKKETNASNARELAPGDHINKSKK